MSFLANTVVFLLLKHNSEVRLKVAAGGPYETSICILTLCVQCIVSNYVNKTNKIRSFSGSARKLNQLDTFARLCTELSIQ